MQTKRGRPRQFDEGQVVRTALKVFWEKGYEQTSIADICAATGVNAPSLYAAFGKKSDFFIKLVNFYEKTYWVKPVEQMFQIKDVFQAIDYFFEQAINILLDRSIPCGCLVVLSSVHIDPNEKEINAEIDKLRQKMVSDFERRLRQGKQDGQLPEGMDVHLKSIALNTYLEGLSLQIGSGLDTDELRLSVHSAVGILRS